MKSKSSIWIVVMISFFVGMLVLGGTSYGQDGFDSFMEKTATVSSEPVLEDTNMEEQKIKMLEERVSFLETEQRFLSNRIKLLERTQDDLKRQL